MKNRYIKYEEDNKNLIAEKIFINKKPRSRVMLSTVKEIKKSLDAQTYNLNSIIDFKKIKKIEGEYYLLSDDSKYYPPLIKKIKEKEIPIIDAVKWTKQILTIWDQIEDESKFSHEIKLNYLRVDKNNNIRLVNPFVNREIEQYKYQELENEYDEIYRPPQVLNKGKWSEKARIYNFGVILYYLTTGRFPFEGKDKTEMFDKKMTGSITAPQYINHNISSKLSDLIKDMLASDEDDRPGSIKEIIEILSKLKDENLINASEEEKQKNRNKSKNYFRKNKFKDKVVFFFRHHWGKTLLVGGLLVILLGMGFLGTSPPVITRNTTPDQVVNHFYNSINNKDPVVIDQTTTVNLKSLENMISEGHVIETMRNAYGSLSEEEKSDSDQVFGIKNINFEKTNKDDYYLYNISYIFYYPREEEMREEEMKDFLTVKKVENKWQITEIKGDINTLIEGKFEG